MYLDEKAADDGGIHRSAENGAASVGEAGFAGTCVDVFGLLNFDPLLSSEPETMWMATVGSFDRYTMASTDGGLLVLA